MTEPSGLYFGPKKRTINDAEDEENSSSSSYLPERPSRKRRRLDSDSAAVICQLSDPNASPFSHLPVELVLMIADHIARFPKNNRSLARLSAASSHFRSIIAPAYFSSLRVKIAMIPTNEEEKTFRAFNQLVKDYPRMFSHVRHLFLLGCETPLPANRFVELLGLDAFSNLRRLSLTSFIPPTSLANITKEMTTRGMAKLHIDILELRNLCAAPKRPFDGNFMKIILAPFKSVGFIHITNERSGTSIIRGEEATVVLPLDVTIPAWHISSLNPHFMESFLRSLKSYGRVHTIEHLDMATGFDDSYPTPPVDLFVDVIDLIGPGLRYLGFGPKSLDSLADGA